MGDVFLAHDESLRRDVAIKMLGGDAVNDPERLSRFAQEAKAASALNHPNILTIYEFVEDNEIHYLVTEFVAGRPLRDLIISRDLQFEQALKIAEQTAFALDAAHSSGIIHRDIKPDNLMIREDGIVKVLDFGLAKLTENAVSNEDDETRELFQTKAGQIFGTANYMSPEQVRGVPDIDGRADIWSLGAMMHEMFAGKPPFNGSTSSDIIASILKTDPPTLPSVMADCPPELERIVKKALKKDRAERYQSARELGLDVRALRKHVEFSKEYERTEGNLSAGQAPVSAEIQEGSVAKKRRPWFWLLVPVLAAAGVIPTALIYFQSSNGFSSENIQIAEIASWASQPGEVYVSGSFSPDGKMIAFSSSKNGGKQIFVKQATAGEAVQVTQGDASCENPVWSPNGDEIAYFSDRGGKPGIWRIPILGGSAQLVSELKDGAAAIRGWLASGHIYFEADSELQRVNAAGGVPERMTGFKDAQLAVRNVTVSSDGKKTAFTVANESSWVLLAGDENGRSGKEIFTGDSEVRNIVWLPSGEGLVFSTQTSGRFQLFGADMRGGQPRQLMNSERDIFALDVASDGSKILLGSAKEESDIWAVSGGREFPVASEINSELWPDVSPDGKRLVFQSSKELSLGNDLFTGKLRSKEIGTENPQAQVSEKGFLPVFSPDGKRVAFLSVEGEKYVLNVVASSGGATVKLTKDGVSPPSYSILPYLRVQANEFSWSPDGQRIAFASRRNGVSNIWTAGVDGEGEKPFTSNEYGEVYFYSPIWSPDGNSVAFTTRMRETGADGKQKYGVRIASEDGVARELYGGSRFVRSLGWTADGGGLIIALPEQQETGRTFSDVEIGMINVADMKYLKAALLKSAYSGNIFLSKDRTLMVFSARREGTDDIWTLSLGGGTERKLTKNSDPRLFYSSLAVSPNGDSIYFGKQSRYSLLSMVTNFKQ
ncbi:MAG: serine/threonine-protein kinase [Acidobacteriota bacterium]|nr:MAG: serine/threonine-protein kinase [Acidobacteriota bacterium]